MLFSIVISVIAVLPLCMLICDVTRLLLRYMHPKWVNILVPIATSALGVLLSLTGSTLIMGYLALFGMCYAIVSMGLRR